MVKTIDDRNKILTFFMAYHSSHSNVVKQFFKSRLFSIFCDTIFWNTETKFFLESCGVAARQARVQVVSTCTATQGPPCHRGPERCQNTLACHIWWLGLVTTPAGHPPSPEHLQPADLNFLLPEEWLENGSGADLNGISGLTNNIDTFPKSD